MIWLIVAVVVVLIVLALSYICYWMAFYNPESRHAEAVFSTVGNPTNEEKERIFAMFSEMDALPYERVYIQSHDGLRLSARYYHVADGAPLQIQFHGYRGNGIRDFCGGNKLARQMGHNTLVVDQRAHGMSMGNTMTFGVLERYDCIGWTNYAARRFGKEQIIFLSGVSMGAATVLMASDLDLPENVAGVIADCSYSDPGEIIRKVSRDMKIPDALSYPFIVLGGLIYGHFAIWEGSPVDSVRNAKVPVLLIHGEADRFVPCDMSRQIYKACKGPKALETFPNAGHGISYIVDTPRYEAAVKQFIRECMNARQV